MKYFTTLLLAGMIFIIFIGCKKSKTEPAPLQLSFSPRALEYVQLTEGKYFIYKDSATSQLDSVVVTKSKLEKKINVPLQVNNQIIPAYNADDFELVLSKFIGATGTEWFYGHAYLSLSLPPHVYASSDTAALDLRGLNSSPEFYFTQSSQTNYSITVEGRTYNNVVVTISNPVGIDISDPNYKKTTFYWAKGVGIIKSEIITTGGVIKTHSLVRNN